MALTQGKRGQPDEGGWLRRALEPGEYVCVNPTQMQDGSPLPDWLKAHYPQWVCKAPNGHACGLSSRIHTIVEHEDGTITVSPSIRITTSQDEGKTEIELWHGYLERGVWRDA